MKVFFENCYWICTSRTKVTKKLFLTSLRHVQYALMFFHYNKQLLSALELVLYEFDANKKCQISLVVKYTYHGHLVSNRGQKRGKSWMVFISMVHSKVNQCFRY